MSAKRSRSCNIIDALQMVVSIEREALELLPVETGTIRMAIEERARLEEEIRSSPDLDTIDVYDALKTYLEMYIGFRLEKIITAIPTHHKPPNMTPAETVFFNALSSATETVWRDWGNDINGSIQIGREGSL